MDLFVPSSRKVKFHCNCILHDASNLPFVSGRYFGKWKVMNGSARGVTSKIGIKDHQVVWNSSFEFDVTAIIGKDKVLQPCLFKLSIKQEMGDDSKPQSIGSIILNLSEFAIERSATRKILLQESKVNSFIKLTITMILMKGDSDSFSIPEPTASGGLDVSVAIKKHNDTQPHPANSSTIQSLNLGRLHSIGNSAEHAQIIDQIFQSANFRKNSST